MNFSFHPSNLAFTRPQILAKVCLLDIPTKAGRPRYFSKPVEIVTPVVLLMKSRKAARVFLLKKREVFAAFNCCPEALS